MFIINIISTTCVYGPREIVSSALARARRACCGGPAFTLPRYATTSTDRWGFHCGEVGKVDSDAISMATAQHVRENI